VEHNQSATRALASGAYLYALNPDGVRGFGIEVINPSAFAVTITEVGFTFHQRRVNKSPRYVIAYPQLPDRKPWPRRLEAREAVSIYFDLNDLEQHRGQKLGKAYATTICGESRYGDSPALNQLREELAVNEAKARS
jgi:hypothetical protein